MGTSGKYKESDETKPYKIKRRFGKFVSVDDINVFVLYHQKNKKYVERMERDLENKRIVFTNGLEDTELAYGNTMKIKDEFDYIVVVVSKQFLEDLDLLDVLVSNYCLESENKKIFPIIIWKELYEPEIGSRLIKTLEERIVKYKKDYFDGDFNGNEATELGRMQQILKMLKDFLPFAKNRDKKLSLSASKKLLKYIQFDRKIIVPDKEIVAEDESRVLNQTINVSDGAQMNIAYGNGTVNANNTFRK